MVDDQDDLSGLSKAVTSDVGYNAECDTFSLTAQLRGCLVRF